MHPLDLNDNDSYQRWRTYKLSHYPFNVADHLVPIDHLHISQEQITQLKTSAHKINMAFYQLPQAQAHSKFAVHTIAKHLGLERLDNNICADPDALTSLHVTKHKGQHDYIPYTNKKLSWHCDGYYNRPDQQIFGVLLHCAMPAQSGGESLLMDHEIAYILLRDENPAYIDAFMQMDAMSIPPNILDGKIIREASTGPIFSMTDSGNLHMRYSARLRNITWKDDPIIKEACDFLQHLWQQEDSPYIIRHTLQQGQGVICNNTLHRRTDFIDANEPSLKRLLFRGRYYDRINHTDTHDINF